MAMRRDAERTKTAHAHTSAPALVEITPMQARPGPDDPPRMAEMGDTGAWARESLRWPHSAAPSCGERRRDRRAGRSGGRVDTDALRALVPVAMALREHGADVRGERGRCACPIHGGDNPHSFSYDRTRWHCYACGAGGDVYGLVMALRRCDFRTALAGVAELAGVRVDGLPRIERTEIARRDQLTRRRAAMDRWHRERRRRWGNRVGDLGREAARLGAYFAASERRDDPRRWDMLDSVHWDLARAEATLASLSTNDEAEIAELWLAERRGELPMGDPT